MTANGVSAWVDPDNDGVAAATRQSAGGGGTPDDASVTDAKIAAAGLTNAAIATAAAIAKTKISGTAVTVADTGTVTSTMITDGTIVTGDLNAAAGITSGQLAGSIAASKIAGTAVTTADTGSVTSTMILDGTIVTGDLNAAAGITSGQLAGSIAPSKVTGTAVTAADTGSVTSTMILDGTILNADVNASAAIAATKVVQPLPPDVYAANVSIYTRATAAYGGKAVAITALKPFFHPIWLPGVSATTISNVRFRVSALLNPSTVGVAIYSATYASAAHVSATLVAQLNVAQTGAATGMFEPALTTGAAGSGASALAMDFTTTRYLLGFMASDVGTLACGGFGLSGVDTSMGVISWTGTARSTTTDWPSSFTEAANIAAMSSAPGIPAIDLVTATGAFYL